MATHSSSRHYRRPVPALPFPSLTDDVVRLRPWRDSDAAAMLAAFADPVFEQHSDWQPRTPDEVYAHLAQVELARRHGEKIDFALVGPADEDTLLGGISLNAVDRPGSRASVGYWLCPSARGRGVATHAVRLLVTWAFVDLGIERLELTCGPENTASQRVAERCGFTREALLRSHLAFKGGRRDTVVFARSRARTA